jgi:hypothetical protein
MEPLPPPHILNLEFLFSLSLQLAFNRTLNRLYYDIKLFRSEGLPGDDISENVCQNTS